MYLESHLCMFMYAMRKEERESEREGERKRGKGREGGREGWGGRGREREKKVWSLCVFVMKSFRCR